MILISCSSLRPQLVVGDPTPPASSRSSSRRAERVASVAAKSTLGRREAVAVARGDERGGERELAADASCRRSMCG